MVYGKIYMYFNCFPGLIFKKFIISYVFDDGMYLHVFHVVLQLAFGLIRILNNFKA